MPTDAEDLAEQVKLCRSLTIGLAKQIATMLPEELEFSLMIFDPKDGTGEVRGLSNTGPVKETVAMLRHYADQIEADAAMLEARRATIKAEEGTLRTLLSEDDEGPKTLQ